MRIVRIVDIGKNFVYKWPEGTQKFDYFIQYIAVAEDGEHKVKIGFGKRHTYDRDRIRVVIWIDDHPHAEFFGADDFEKSGEVLSVIKVSRKVGERICKYPDEPIPERYTMFDIVGLPLRVQAHRVQ